MNISLSHDVPDYLRKSELYLSFTKSGGDRISVPKDCLKRDPTVKTMQDLEHLFRTMRYWILTIFPDDLIRFLLIRLSCHGRVLQKFENEFPNLREVVRDINTAPKQTACQTAARHGRVDFLNYFAWRKYPCDLQTLQVAAEYGQFDCLRYMHRLLAEDPSTFSLKAIDCSAFIKQGNLKAVKYLVHHGVEVTAAMCEKAAEFGRLHVLMFLLLKCPVPMERIALVAATHDHQACLQFAMEPGCPMSTTLRDAAIAAPGTACLEYLISTHSALILTAPVFLNTCKLGKLAPLKALVRHDCPLHDISYAAAAKSGSLECLQFLSSLGFDCWVPNVVALAAYYGHVALLKALLEQGCPWDARATKLALKAPTDKCLKMLLRHACSPTCRTLGLGDRKYCRKCVATGKYINKPESRREGFELDVLAIQRELAENKWLFAENRRWFEKNLLSYFSATSS